jgi:hypothetical protein
MIHRRFLLGWVLCLLALLVAHPALHAAEKKQAAPKKAHPAKPSGPTDEELFRQKAEQEIEHLRTELYGRATWTAL